MYRTIRDYLLRKFREVYENRIQVKFGIHQFLNNVAFIQLSNEEQLTLPPASSYGYEITLTTVGLRPLLRYRYWPKGMEFKGDLPEVEVIVEKNCLFQVRPAGQNIEWELVDLTDERVAVLKDLFLGFAFYPPLRPEWKVKK